MDKDKLVELAERLEAAGSQFDFDMVEQSAICGAFGVRQERLDRAGWKRWWPDTRRWGSASRPASSLDDLRHLLESAGCLPDTFRSTPWFAAADALRLRAAALRSHALDEND